MRLRAVGYVSCPKCGGGLPGEVHDDLVCRCGTDRGLGRADWENIAQMVMIRSGARCEIRSPECLGGDHGSLLHLPRDQWSLHHRRPRGMGGSKRVDVHSLAMLVGTCGHGSKGCHRYAEIHRTWAEARGLLLPKEGVADVADPARVPLVMPSGHRVLLDPFGPLYHEVEDGRPKWVLVPLPTETSI